MSTKYPGALDSYLDLNGKLPISGSTGGSVTVTNFPATQPVSLSFPATQPVSLVSVPLPTGAALDTTITALIGKFFASTAVISASPSITTSSAQIIGANANRKGLILYNNSANSVYIAYTSPANSSTNMTAIVATFAQWVMTFPIYTGAIYGIRNAGSGTVLATELT